MWETILLLGGSIVVFTVSVLTKFKNADKKLLDKVRQKHPGEADN